MSVTPTGEQLYTMVTSRFKSGSFPWEMVAESGKEAWSRAASDLVFAPDTIMARFSEQEIPQSFQDRVYTWMLACFNPTIAADVDERNFRFLEEAVELVQSCNCSREDAHDLVDYVFNRPIGEAPQEVGGVMVTLAALCLAQHMNMHECAEVELARINEPEVMEKIRAKQAAKPQRSPRPE